MLSVALALGAGCEAADDLLCPVPGCQFSAEAWAALESLAGLPAEPPDDPSNQYARNPRAQELGQQLYFDPRFSGTATLVDMLRRPVPYARAAQGQPLHIACATCHDPARAGGDFTSVPNTVSIGAGWYDVNGQQTVNAAYYGLTYWNGRNDSLWSQIVAVTESSVSMGSNRLQVAWLLRDKYADAYAAVFPTWPLPFPSGSAAVAALVEPKTKADGSRNPRGGQCLLAGGACPAPCRAVAGADGAPSCWPRFPLEGRPGATAGCQPGSPDEPFNDAWDCMAPADQALVTRVYVNFAKAIAAYEYRLVSRDAPFDRWVAEGPDSERLRPAQRRGAALFVGKASCIECHATPLFSDSRFHNVGVPQVGPGVPTLADCPAGHACDCVNRRNCLPDGALDGLGKLHRNGFRRDSQWSDAPNDPAGRAWLELPLDEALAGAWRTPSLRDVEKTAPYMHNGVYRTLEEVIDAYDRGGASAEVVGRKSVRVKPLHLTAREKADLVEFLRALNGAPLPATLTSAPVLPP